MCPRHLVWPLAAVMLTGGLSSVHADEGSKGRTRVLHEPPPTGGQRARTDRVVAGESATKDLPAAIDTAAGRVERPDGPTAGGASPPLYDTAANSTDSPDRVRPDRRTGGESDLQYGVVFDPSVMPFKRDRVFDQVAADGSMIRSGQGRVLLRPRGREPRPGHELFWGQLTLTLAAGEHTAVPSVSPESMLLQWQSTPPLPLTFHRDRAGNWSVSSARGGTVVLRILVDAPSGYFAAPLGEGAIGDDPWRPQLAPELQRQMAALWPALDVHPMRYDRSHNLRQLAAWYRAFEAGELPTSDGGALLAELTVARRGVCRHRSMAFVAMAHSLGIPSHYVMNDAHAFVEAWALGGDGRGAWQRIDLGGSADTLHLHSAANKHLHQPLYNDPLPRPEAYATAIGQASHGAGLDATSWAGARKVLGSDQMSGAGQAKGRGPPAAASAAESAQSAPCARRSAAFSRVRV